MLEVCVSLLRPPRTSYIVSIMQLKGVILCLLKDLSIVKCPGSKILAAIEILKKTKWIRDSLIYFRIKNLVFSTEKLVYKRFLMKRLYEWLPATDSRKYFANVTGK